MKTAAFGNKIFEVQNKKVYTVDDVSISEELQVETVDVEGSKQSVYVKGQGAMTVSFITKLDARYVNVLNEIDWWMDTMRAGIPYWLTVGSKLWSDHKMLITSTSIGSAVIGKNGAYNSAILTLSFIEASKLLTKSEYAASQDTGKASSGKKSHSTKSKSKKKPKKKTDAELSKKYDADQGDLA